MRALLLEEEELEEEEKKMQEKLSTEEAIALRQCSLCDALSDAQIVEILDASRTKSAFERGEDVSDESGFTKRGEEIAILCRGAFAIESMVLVTSDDGDEEKDAEERIDVNATTMVTRVGACVGSLVDVLDVSPPALLVDTGEATASSSSKSSAAATAEGDTRHSSSTSSSSSRHSKSRLRAVAASDDATFVVVPLNVFHDVMNQTVGAHALGSR